MENEDLKRLIERLEKNQEDFMRRLEEKFFSPGPDNAKWIDHLSVQAELGISKSTVYRLTRQGILEARRIGQRSYYNREEIFKLRDRYLK